MITFFFKGFEADKPDHARSWMISIQDEACLLFNDDTAAELLASALVTLNPVTGAENRLNQILDRLTHMKNGLSTMAGVIPEGAVMVAPVHPSSVDDSNALIYDATETTWIFSSPLFRVSAQTPRSVSDWDMVVDTARSRLDNNPFCAPKYAHPLSRPHSEGEHAFDQRGAALALTAGVLLPLLGTPASLHIKNQHIQLAGFLAARREVFDCPKIQEHYHWGCKPFDEAKTHTNDSLSTLSYRGAVCHDSPVMGHCLLEGPFWDRILSAALSTPRGPKAFRLGQALSTRLASLTQHQADTHSLDILYQNNLDHIQFGSFLSAQANSAHDALAMRQQLEMLKAIEPQS